MGPFYIVLIATMLGSAVICLESNSEETSKGMAEIAADKALGTIKYRNLQLPALGAGQKVENIISKSLHTAQEVFGEIKKPAKSLGHGMKTADFGMKAAGTFSKISKKIAKFIPYASEVIDIATGFVELFEEETDWRNEFKKVFAELIPEALVKHSTESSRRFLEVVGDKLQTINKTILDRERSLSKIEENMKLHPENCESYERQKLNVEQSAHYGSTVAISLLMSFDLNIKSFTTWNSTLKHYPLIAAPSLIEMSLMVSVLEPLAIQLVGNKVEKRSCVVRDAIYDFLPFLIEARLEALNADQTNMIAVRNAPFNKTGYTNSDYLKCAPSENCISTFFRTKDVDALCLIDKLGSEKYEAQSGERVSCEIGYAQHLRHLIEKMFETPLEISNKMCGQPTQNTTGNSLISKKQMTVVHILNG